MQNNKSHYIKNLWRWSAGLPELPEGYPTLDYILKSQWSPIFIKWMKKIIGRDYTWSLEFEAYMRNRLTFGYFRYAPLGDQPRGKMDNVGSIESRIVKYRDTGNDELLVDIANIALVEFLLGEHSSKHFNIEQCLPDYQHCLRTNRVSHTVWDVAGYRRSGNRARLLGVATLAMIEFTHGTHPKKHFTTEDDGEHVQIKQ